MTRKRDGLVTIPLWNRKLREIKNYSSRPRDQRQPALPVAPKSLGGGNEGASDGNEDNEWRGREERRGEVRLAA